MPKDSKAYVWDVINVVEGWSDHPSAPFDTKCILMSPLLAVIGKKDFPADPLYHSARCILAGKRARET